MKYASVCSGVEAASLAWKPLGWEQVWFSEIEPFPCEVLAQRFPGALEGAGKMKCDICKDDFPDDELVEADIMTCDDDGNICEGPKSHVGYMCRTLIVAVGIENQS